MNNVNGAVAPQGVAAGQHTDILVIGAGNAGLIAARKLVAAGKTVRVLEAADRVGGRTYAIDTAVGSRVDLGGQWVGYDHTELKALLEEFGLEYYPQYDSEGTMVVVDGEALSIGEPWIAEAQLAFAEFEATIFGDVPEAWNTLTVAEWISQRLSDPRAQRFAEMMCTGQTTSETHLLTMALWGQQVRAGGGFEHINATAGGPQESLIYQGLGAVATTVAAELGDRVQLNERVLSVRKTDQHFVVTTEQGEYTAQQVISAVPAPLLAEIDFNGLITPELTEYGENAYMGVVYKAMVVYDTPFWRNGGYIGGAVMGEYSAAIADASPPEGPGHITVLIGGAGARKIQQLSEAERKHAILSQIAVHAGEAIMNPVEWHDKAWFEDPFVRGGYSAQPLPTATSYHPPVSCDLGNGIFVAGTEFSPKYFGYVEGALRTGIAAAEAALAAAE